MIDWLIAQVRERPELAFFVTITLGYAIGRLRTGTFTLGAVADDGDETSQSKRPRFGRSGRGGNAFTVTVGIVFCIGTVLMTASSLAQTASASGSGETSQLLPADRQEIADQERLSSWTVNKIPPQPYMNEIYWNLPNDTPAFFRDTLVQFVARTYDLTRDNADGTRSQGWAVGGWLAFRSGLVGDIFGVHAAYYTSQKLFAPLDEEGTRLLAPGQNSIGTLGQIYGRAQFGDQEFRGGYQLVDTPLINPQDNRMVPNTFGGITLDSLPDKDRNYDYALGYLWTVKERDSNDFIPMSDALAGDAINHGAAFGMVKWRPISGLSTVFMDYNIQDYVNSGFAQVEYDFRQPNTVPNWIVGANIITQQSVGANLLTGSPFRPTKPRQSCRWCTLDGHYSRQALSQATSPTYFHRSVPGRPTPTCNRLRSKTRAKRRSAAVWLTILATQWDFQVYRPGSGTRVAGTRWTPPLSRPFPIAANSTSGFSTGRPMDL